jgi:hypothetical protein
MIGCFCAFLSIEGVKDMKKYTCWKDENSKVEGAIEGTKEEVLAWMLERFPGLKPDADPSLWVWEFFNNVETEHYLTDEGSTVFLVKLDEGKMLDETDSQ